MATMARSMFRPLACAAALGLGHGWREAVGARKEFDGVYRRHALLGSAESLLESSVREASSFPVTRKVLQLAPAIPWSETPLPLVPPSVGVPARQELAAYPHGRPARGQTRLHNAANRESFGNGNGEQPQGSGEQPKRKGSGQEPKGDGSPGKGPQELMVNEPSLMADMAVGWLKQLPGSGVIEAIAMFQGAKMPWQGREKPVQRAWRRRGKPVKRAWRRVLRLAKDFVNVFNRVRIPSDWSDRLKRRSLRLVHRDHDSRVFVGRLASDDSPIALKVASAKNTQARREIQMLLSLRDSENVVKLIASEEFPDATYMLMTAADTNLEEYVRLRFRPDRYGIPLNESLPILVDLLRGIRDLGDHHIAHGDLSEKNILMKDGRPLISDFGLASIVRDDDEQFGYAVERPPLTLSDVVRMAPETIRGVPTGASNNVYHVGAIFSWMCLGYFPMHKTIQNDVPQVMNANRNKKGWEPEVDDHAQDVIRRGFVLQRDSGFINIRDEDAQEIMMGLLERSLDRRWTAVGALEHVLAIAHRRGIAVPPERRSPVAAAASAAPAAIWQGDWE